MTLFALLSARTPVDDRSASTGGPTLVALLPLAGQTLIEYQARQLCSAGAAECAIVVDAILPDLAAAVDRLQRDGIRVTLVRDMPVLARMIAPTDQVLMLGEGHVLPTDSLRALARQQPPLLLTLPGTPETREFERIDGDGMWAGAALAPGGLLLSTLDMLGEWDLSLTIVRLLVQDGAGRRPCDVAMVLDGRVAVVRDAEGASAAASVLSRGVGVEKEQANSDDLLFGRLAGILAQVATRRGFGADRLRIAGIACAALSLASMLLWSVAIGAMLGFAALMLERVAARVESVLRLIDIRRRTERLPLAIILAGLFLLGWSIGSGGALAMLGAAVAPASLAVVPVAASLAATRRPPPWSLVGPATALAMLFMGSLLSAPASALALAGLAAFVGAGWALRRAADAQSSTDFSPI